jgi:thioredoxin reductase (NADPH)
MDYDCLIIGGGPAGLAAATYLGRFCRRVLLVDAGNSRARAIPESHNYPGFDKGISGPKLLNIMHQQARQYGAVMVSGMVTSLTRNGDGFRASADGRPVDAARP